MSIPLSRNRNFHLLWITQASSELTNQVFVLVYPLLTLAVLGSPAAAGLVGTALVGAQLAVGLPAGVLADRWDRKRILLLCAGIRTIAYTSIGVAVWQEALTFPHLLVAAAIEGAALAATFPAEEAALPQVVGNDQLQTALALNSARVSLGQLLGNTFGGLLFGLSRVFPFLLNGVLTALSFVVLLFLRIPGRPRPEDTEAEAEHVPPERFWRNLSAGVRWVVQQPIIRLTSICAVALNMSFTAILIIVIMRAEQQNTPSLLIGVMMALLGVGGLLGALAATRLHKMLSPYVAITGVIWISTLLVPLVAFAGHPLVAGGLLAVGAFIAPTANTTIVTYQLLLTPDSMRGRLSGAMGVLDGTAGAIGPALGGVLMQVLGPRDALFVCAVLMLLPAIVSATSPTLRRFRGMADIDEAAGPNGPMQEERINK
ncbi:MFS transporter [Amycolatopsis antarctica]|uniref:MFS transporter n=1 Tax=Amycolatopsis antarctica TaxID=1854586 RepID=UPI0013FDC7F0|nr:MFS transporter [Amycolatopsis antarctica]